jgi:hypothetical protein
MFQYAFARMTARRLGVKFYFPEWIGDKVFCLNDEDERATVIEGVHRKYVQTKSNIANLDYYVKALSYVNNSENLLVVSDEIDRARRIAERLSGNIVYADDTKGHEDLYLRRKYIGHWKYFAGRPKSQFSGGSTFQHRETWEGTWR